MKSFFTVLFFAFFMQIFAQTEYQKYLSPFQKMDTHEITNKILFRGVAQNGMDRLICIVDSNGLVINQKFFSGTSPIVNSIIAVASDSEFIIAKPLTLVF